MISRKIATLLLVCMLTMALNVMLVDASPRVSFYTYGNAIAAWSPQPKIGGDYSVKLYVKDGRSDWAEVSIPIDIAIEDISEIRFYQFIESYSPTGWAVNVVLGVDCDGDGFESDVSGWQVVQTLDPAMLGDDSFVQMDGTPGPNPPIGSWNPVDAFNTPQWYTPNVAGNAYELFYGTLGNFISSLPVGRVAVGDRVKVLKLLIGGSGSWMENTAYVDYGVINGVVYDFEFLTATGTGTVTFALSSGALTDLEAVSESSLPTAGKPALSFPHGFFSFKITGIDPGATVTVTITLPSAVPVGTQYWKYHASEGGWIRIPMGSDNGDNVITITLVDGGLGDDDRAKNGVIVDQGGPGLPRPPKPVGGTLTPVNKLTVLAPYLALIGLTGAVTLAVAKKRKRKPVK